MAEPNYPNAKIPQNKDVFEKILDLIECPICNETLLPPIIHCMNGHAVCMNCRPRVNQCGLCNGQFTRNRSIPLEALVSAITFECKYRVAGCQKVMKGDGLHQHQTNCKYRHIVCNEKSTNPCENGEISYDRYVEHLLKQHNFAFHNKKDALFSLNQSSTLDVAEASWKSFIKYYIHDGIENTFFLNTKVQNYHIYWWVTCLDDDFVDNFRCQLSIHKDFRNPQALQWNFPVYSFRVKFEDIKGQIISCASSQNLIPISNANNGMKLWCLKGKIQARTVEDIRGSESNRVAEVVPLEPSMEPNEPTETENAQRVAVEFEQEPEPEPQRVEPEPEPEQPGRDLLSFTRPFRFRIFNRFEPLSLPRPVEPVRIIEQLGSPVEPNSVHEQVTRNLPPIPNRFQMDMEGIFSDLGRNIPNGIPGGTPSPIFHEADLDENSPGFGGLSSVEIGDLGSTQYIPRPNMDQDSDEGTGFPIPKRPRDDDDVMIG